MGIFASGAAGYKASTIAPAPVRPVVITGDLQKTSFIEKCMGRESNDRERLLLVKEMVGESPAMMVLLGDMVFDGSNSFEWKDFDLLFAQVRQHNIPVFPVAGNHEYCGLNYAAEKNFKVRFTKLQKSVWYTEKYDSISMVFLNSNREDMPAAEWNKQKLWYEKTLKQFDNDSSVKAVVTFLHHPAYTNSLVTGDEPDVQLAFVPAYFKSHKSLLMISGHAHTYERFQKDGKTFIVAGGGGGPRVELHKGTGFHKDLYTGSSPRPFHFLLLTRTPTGLKIIVRGLKKAEKKFFTMEEINLPYKPIAAVAQK